MLTDDVSIEKRFFFLDIDDSSFMSSGLLAVGIFRELLKNRILKDC